MRGGGAHRKDVGGEGNLSAILFRQPLEVV